MNMFFPAACATGGINFSLSPPPSPQSAFLSSVSHPIHQKFKIWRNHIGAKMSNTGMKSQQDFGLRMILFQSNKLILKWQAKLNKIIVGDLLDACEICSKKLGTFH